MRKNASVKESSFTRRKVSKGREISIELETVCAQKSSKMKDSSLNRYEK
jgi:hypothetical protein